MGAKRTVRRFLARLRSFFTIEADLAECAAARIKAEDEMRDMRVRMADAIEAASKAREELSRALKQVANYEALRSGPIVPFPDVYQPMPQPEQELTVEERSPVLPRTMREYEQAARAVSRKAAEERRRGLFQALDVVTEN